MKAEVASSRALAQELTQKTVALTTSQASVAALQAEVAALKSADEAMLKEKSDALARSDAEKAGVNLKLQVCGWINISLVYRLLIR